MIKINSFTDLKKLPFSVKKSRFVVRIRIYEIMCYFDTRSGMIISVT